MPTQKENAPQGLPFSTRACARLQSAANISNTRQEIEQPATPLSGHTVVAQSLHLAAGDHRSLRFHGLHFGIARLRRDEESLPFLERFCALWHGAPNEFF